ncbi:MAG: hypothetical protein M1816_004242 [Peltula sp. TS41687]|nr:MAG: hypothetical protein M1816_004242 [Peltula sp. TS41687]
MAMDKRTGELLAVKELLRSSKNHLSVQQEVGIVKLFKHRRVAELKVVLYENSVNYQGPGPDKVYLLMRWASCGDLRAILPTLSMEQRGIVFRQMLEGIEYIHRLGVVHRDVKPENIAVVDLQPLSVILIDFGLSSKDHDPTSFVGSQPYWSPEVDRKGVAYEKSVDIVACGLLGREMFERPRKHRCVDQIDYNNLQAALDQAKTSSVQSFLSQMIRWQPSARSTATQCLVHSFILSVQSLDEMDSENKAG